MPEVAATFPVRRRLSVRGQVQGVGFRPHAYRLARSLGVTGWVRNGPQGVEAEVQGPGDAVAEFLRRLAAEAPPLARLGAIEVVEIEPAPVESGFDIVASGRGPAGTGVTPDTAICGDCLRELFDPGDRRYRYPFINCTHCGPRFTLTAALPYDRPNTAMARFELCERCRAEYEDPLERRFHAQPNACPACGPRLQLLDAAGRALEGADPIAETLAAIRAGSVVALKGLGGFHLACDARNAAAVVRLRERKQREEKPLAVMAAGAESLSALAAIGAAERVLLAAPERPIVLLPKRAGCDERLAGVAPGIAWLGAMLPYTPLHYLLFHQAAGRPAGTGWIDEPHELLLVMTSANPGGEPLVTGNDEAVRRLGSIADRILVHDRDILVRCDDSVMRCAGKEQRFIRRARGYTPRGVVLATDGPATLALGAWYKNTVCLTREREAFLSQHVGDLDNAASCEALEEAVAHLMRVLEIRPRRIAHDLHPDFFSTRLARRLAAELDVPPLAVQHHHAHAAAVAAEHGLEAPVLALTLDGVGLGTDGAPWGGELLRLRGAAFDRLGHLSTLALPGGDRAAREPWRMGASALHALGRGEEIAARFQRPEAQGVRELIERAVNAPHTSSAGRLFDAAAALLDVCTISAYEGQAAMLLEGLAAAHGPAEPYADGFRVTGAGRLDVLPLLARVCEERDAARGAARFHATLAAGLAEWVRSAARETGLEGVVLAGGCFMNHVLSTALAAELRSASIEVFEASRAPPNDGGISLGQAWVARQEHAVTSAG